MTETTQLKRMILLDVLMACWGMGTWLGVNGVYVQLPLLVERLPEGWGLPASISVVVAVANVGLPIYALLHRLFPRVPDSTYIYGLLSLGMIGLYLSSFLYETTAIVGNSERSVVFLIFTLFAGLVGCTSSVLFYPYMRFFHHIYLPTYLVGEGLSGFIPSILSLIQGVGGEAECEVSSDNSTMIATVPPARFTITVFLVLLGTLALISLIAFTLIDRLSIFDSERIDPALLTKSEEAETAPEDFLLTEKKWMIIMLMTVVLNGMTNGVLPSIQSFSCMPFGTQTYHLAVALATMSNPLACLAGVWMEPVSPAVLGALLTLNLAPLGFMLATALQSPAPVLVGTAVGSFLVVSSWVCATAILSYSRMWLYTWARRGGSRGMRAVGASTQLGSLIAASTMFALVNYTGIFVQPKTCPMPATDTLSVLLS